MVTSNKTQSLCIQWSRCAIASLMAPLYQSFQFRPIKRCWLGSASTIFCTESVIKDSIIIRDVWSGRFHLLQVSIIQSHQLTAHFADTCLILISTAIEIKLQPEEWPKLRPSWGRWWWWWGLCWSIFQGPNKTLSLFVLTSISVLLINEKLMGLSQNTYNWSAYAIEPRKALKASLWIEAILW